MEENKNKVNNAENGAVNDAANGAANDAENGAVNDAVNNAENDAVKDTANNAESYDFMADAKATIKGLIGRTKEHGLFERKDDVRALVCMAMDVDGENILFTAHGMPHVVAAGISAYLVENGLAEIVKKAIDMYER